MIYKTENGSEIDIEAATVYINRPDLVLKVVSTIPDSVPLHFVEEIGISKCESLKAKIAERKNVFLYEKEQQGCATDWNYVTRQCKAPWLLLVSSDVAFLPGCLDATFDMAVANPQIKVWSYKKKNMKAWLYNVEFFWEMGGFDEDYWIGGEDEDFMWKMMKKGHEFGIFRTFGIDHLEGGAHTRKMERPVNHIRSTEIQWKKWGWTNKDQMKADVREIETKMRHFWCAK
jgi:hypothetical protein